MGFLVFPRVFLCLLAPLAVDAQHVYVNSQCDQTIPLSFDGQISVHLNPRYWTRNTSCPVTVVSTSNTMLYFEEFEVDCRNGYITVTDENNNYVNGLGRHLCDIDIDDDEVFVPTKRTLIITYHAGRDGYTDNEFTLIVTPYTDKGSCPENGHVCSNGRCIKKTFACNGYNSCGDGSECDPADMSTSSIVGIVVGCAVAIAFAIGIVVVLCWIKRVRRVSKRTSATPAVAYSANMLPSQPSAPLAVNQPAYGYQGQANYGYLAQASQNPSIPQADLQPPIKPADLPPPYEETWSNRPDVATAPFDGAEDNSGYMAFPVEPNKANGSQMENEYDNIGEIKGKANEYLSLK